MTVCVGLRRRIKKFIIAAYCWHLVPAWAADAAFRAFRLGAL